MIVLTLMSVCAFLLFTQQARNTRESTSFVFWSGVAFTVLLFTIGVQLYLGESYSLQFLILWCFVTAFAIIAFTKTGHQFFRTDSKPPTWALMLLGLVPFVLLVSVYLDAAFARHAANEMDKVMPIPEKILEGFKRVAFEEDKRSGDLRLWVDTLASLKRFGIAMIFICAGVLVGVNMGVFRWLEGLLKPFLLFFDKVPALALLPLIFVLFAQLSLENPGEWWKITLLVVGVAPTIMLDSYLRAKDVPREQIFKAQTLAATEQEICYRVVLPRIMPDVLNTIRLNLKSVWVLLIAAESVEASVGLGYRIFVVRRYMAMDIIIPYVLWIALLALVADYAIQFLIKKRYPWHDAE